WSGAIWARRTASRHEGRAGARRPSIVSDWLRSGRDQVGDQVRYVGRPQSGHRVPPLAGAPARDRGLLVAVLERVVEVGRVLARVVGDRVERRVDEPEVAPRDLVRHRDQAGPLRGAGTGAADGVPAGAARTRPTAAR